MTTNSGLGPQDQELIAAFIDRRMSAAERQAFMKRLDAEEELYEVFVETVRFHDQDVAQPATVIAHPAGRRRWGRLAAIAALVAVALATPAVLRNLADSRYAPRLVADSLLDSVLEEGWYVKTWSVMRGPRPGTDEFETAFRLGVRHLDLEVALRLGRLDDARILAAELGNLLQSVELSEPLQLLYEREVGERIDEPGRALREAEENEALLVDYLGDAATAYDLGKWTEAGLLAAESGNTALLGSRAFRRSLRGFEGEDLSELADELKEIARLLGAAGDEMDLPRLKGAFTAIIEQS